MTINRVCRFNGFPLNLVRTFTDMQQKCVGKFFYLNTFFFLRGGFKRSRLRFSQRFSIVELDRSIIR